MSGESVENKPRTLSIAARKIYKMVDGRQIGKEHIRTSGTIQEHYLVMQNSVLELESKMQ